MCGTVFVVLSRFGLRIWIIIKIIINEEKPHYTVKMRLKNYERIEKSIFESGILSLKA